MTGNMFYEHAVKAKPGKDYYIKMLLSALVIVIGVFLFLFVGGIGLLVAVVGVFILCAFAPDSKVEYEYTFTNGSVEIAAIYNSSKRKELFAFEMDNVAMVVPENSSRIAYEKFALKRDYRGKNREEESIALVVERDNAKQLVLMQPNEKAMEHIRMHAKHKIYDC